MLYLWQKMLIKSPPHYYLAKYTCSGLYFNSSLYITPSGPLIFFIVSLQIPSSGEFSGRSLISQAISGKAMSLYRFRKCHLPPCNTIKPTRVLYRISVAALGMLLLCKLLSYLIYDPLKMWCFSWHWLAMFWKSFADGVLAGDIPVCIWIHFFPS